MPFILEEQINISSLPFDADGEKIEPEQRPAERLLTVEDTPTMLGNSGTPSGIKTEISITMPALDLAIVQSECCALCKNFNNGLWRRIYYKLSETKSGLEELRNVQGMLNVSCNQNFIDQFQDDEGEYHPEQAMESFGVCMAMTEAVSKQDRPVIIHPAGHCPETLPVPGPPQPFPNSFTPRESDDTKRAAEIYDEIMLTSAGQK